MPRTMYDAVNVDGVPADATMCAGYVDGNYQSYRPMVARFPAAEVATITVYDGDALVLDVETGDASPQMAGGWVQRQQQAGKKTVLYCNSSTWPAVQHDCQMHSVTPDGYWVAQYDNDPTIPAEWVAAGCVAKQYQSTDNYDISSVLDTWPSTISTGATAAAVVATAAGEVGYEGTPNEGSKYGDWYGLPNQPWCAMFTSWVFAQNGMGDIRYAYCPTGVDFWKGLGRFDHTARVGDVVFYDWDADGVASHTGLVESVDLDGTVHTIEGNRDLPGDDGNPEVARHTIPGGAGWGVVLGFAHPFYGTTPAPSLTADLPPFGDTMDPAFFVRWCYATVLVREPDDAAKQAEWEDHFRTHGPDLTYAGFLDSAEGQARQAQRRRLLDEAQSRIDADKATHP